jgi:PEP-CTERM motif
MRRFSTLVAALGAVFAMSSAQAMFITVDDFNGPDMFVVDTTTAASGGVVQGPVGPVNSPGTLQRTVKHELFTGPNSASGLGSSVLIGNDAFPAGSLNVNNATGRDSEVSIAWLLPANFLLGTGPASFRFDVISSDANLTNARLFFGGAALVSGASALGTEILPVGGFNIPGNTANTAEFFNFSDAVRQQINAGGWLRLVINGEDGWDLSLDSFGFQVPEPTSLALVGLALVGAGVVSRRRKVQA